MRVVGLPRAFYRIARHLPVELSPRALERLRWLNGWRSLRERGLPAQETSQILGIPRSTLYRWQKRLKEQGPPGLEDRSRRPKRHRQPTWSPELAQAMPRLREEYPRWGKDAAEEAGLAGVHLHGGAHSEAPQGAGGAPGTPQEWSGYQ